MARRDEKAKEEIIRVTVTPCVNFPGCGFPAAKPDDFSEDERKGRMLCRHCYRIENERMVRWINAGRPTAEESIAKMYKILGRKPRYQSVGSFTPIGELRERVPGEDDV